MTKVIQGSFPFIDDNQAGSRFDAYSRHFIGWANHKTGTHNDKKIALFCMPEGALQFLLGQRIAEVNDAGNQPAPAGADVYPPGCIHLNLAPLTPKLGDIAVQFGQEIRPDARCQVEVIHILRNEETQFTQLL
jgi:hypothetical protein